MAYFNVTTTQSTLFARISAGFQTLLTRYQNYRMYQETFNELNTLTNRELADLGLHRSELHRVAYEAIYK